MKEIKVIIVDDHFLFRLGLKTVFSTSTQESIKVNVVAEAQDAESFYKLLDQGIEADIAILDIKLPGISGIEIAEKIINEKPNLKTLMLSAESSNDILSSIMKLEIGGFISKEAPSSDIFRALECIYEGGNYYGKDIATLINNIRVAKSDISDINFTPREIEILELSAKGKYAKEIAFELGLNHKTVAVHKTNIFKKLGIHSSHELVMYAIKTGMIRP